MILLRPLTTQPAIAALADGPIAAATPDFSAFRVFAKYPHEARAVNVDGTNSAPQPGRSGYISSDLIGLGSKPEASSSSVFRLSSTANSTSSVWERPARGVTVLAVVERVGAGAGNTPIFSNSSPNESPYTAWGLMNSDGGERVAFQIGPNGVYTEISVPAVLVTKKLFVLVGTYDGSVARLFANGVLIGTTSVSGNLVYPNSSDRGPAIGNYWLFSGGTRSFNGRVYLAALWDRGLSVDEVGHYSSNPWTVFAPRRILLPGASAAITPPTLLAASAVNIGATFATPRVTFTRP